MFSFVNKQDAVDPEAQWFPLSSLEEGIYNKHRPAGLESRFVSSNKIESIKALRERAVQVAAANPWVHGRLKRHPSSRQLCLWVPSAPSQDFLEIISVENMMCDTILREANCGTGDDCLEQQTPVVKLRLFVVEESDEFLLTLSVCHQVSDATALYKLWGMLDSRADIIALDNRRQSRRNLITSAHGLWSKKKFLYSLFLMESSPLRKKHQIDKSQLVPLFHTIRPEWIAEQKKEHKPTSKAPFVSTQDIVTSWFMTTFRPACGALVVNLRNRPSNPGLDESVVGNYLDLLIMNPAEYSNPGLIRQIVSTMGGASLWSRPGSGSLQGTVSCWHSLYHDLQLPRCTRLTHLPLRGGMFCLSSTPNSRMAMTLFKTSPTTTAIMGFAPRIQSNQVELTPLGSELER